MTPPVRCVVDASVVIKLLVDEPASAEADALFAHLAADPNARFVVPSLVYVECANILWKCVRRFGLDVKQAERDLQDLTALALACVDTKDIVADALDLAVRHGITAYDASYAVAARRTGLPLITADGRLARKLEGAGLPVLVLGRFPIPPVP